MGAIKTNDGRQSDSEQRGSIKKKLLFRTLTAAVAGLLTAAILISLISGIQIQHLENENIMLTSQNAAQQISEYFTKYIEISKQLAANGELLAMLEELESGQSVTEHPNFDCIMETMHNMHNTDAKNMVDVWAADVESNQFFEDTGYISEIGVWDITTRSWYHEVMAAKDTVVTEPYIMTSTGELVTSIITPIYNSSGALSGVAALDLSLNALTEMMAAQKLGSSGFFFLMTQSGVIMYAKDDELLQTSIQNADISSEIKKGFANKKYQNYTYHFGGHKNYGYMSLAGESGWVVLSGMPSAEYNADFYKVLASIVFLFLCVIAALCIVISKIATGIAKPIHQLHEVAEQIAVGQLDVELSIESNDEIGEVAAAIDKTVFRLKDYIKYIDEIATVLNDIAKGNLQFTLNQDYAGEFGKIKAALQHISKTLSETIKGIRASADQVNSGAGQISQAAQALAEGATNQAAAVDELLATVTDISSQVRINADYAKNAAENADIVKKNIELSNGDMNELVSAMEEINSCSDAIRTIIGNIEQIADQTSLLSLNASIEAARAGEMGRGFGVVAGEVGNLSKESVIAVQKSTELIQNSVNAVQRGMNLVNKAAERLAESVEGVVDLTSMMNELSEASQNEMGNLSEVEKGISQIANVVTDNSAMAEESAASSEQLSAQATTLNDMIDLFQV